MSSSYYYIKKNVQFRVCIICIHHKDLTEQNRNFIKPEALVYQHIYKIHTLFLCIESELYFITCRDETVPIRLRNLVSALN